MRKTNFDITNDTYPLPYGYIVGDSKVLVIKAGKGGEYCGYDNKYLQIATDLNEKYGFTVICISNPIDVTEGVSDADIIAHLEDELNIRSPEIFLMGTSDGAIKGLQLMASGIGVKKLLLVNMPLMINFYKSLKYITSSPESKITFVYGDKDPSFPYLPFLRLKKLPNVEIVTVSDADHNFKGKTDEFIDIAVNFFGSSD